MPRAADPASPPDGAEGGGEARGEPAPGVRLSGGGRDVPARSDYTLRPFLESDLEEIDGIDRECFGEDARSLSQTLQRAAEAWADVYVVVAVAPAAGVVGYIAWREQNFLCSFLQLRYGVASCVEVLSLAVLPGHRGQRVGQRLLEIAEAEAAACFPAAECMRLHVRADNAAAQQLYGRLGYRRVARVGGYYGDDCDAWEMVRELPPMRRRRVAPALVQQLVGLGFDRQDAELAARWGGACEEVALDLLTGDVPFCRYVQA